MWAILTAAWKDLGPTGKMVVAVVILLAGAALLGLAMWLGYNLDWLPGMLGGSSMIILGPPSVSRYVSATTDYTCDYCGSAYISISNFTNCPNCGAQRTATIIDAPKPKPPMRPVPNNTTELR